MLFRFAYITLVSSCKDKTFFNTKTIKDNARPDYSRHAELSAIGENVVIKSVGLTFLLSITGRPAYRRRLRWKSWRV